ncbi:MAG TPA: ParB/RepB/Spo0J family partition protein [Sphingomicrobium sp.]
MIETMKLNKLRLSHINVRTAPDEQLQIEPLAANIEAKGVLQNLLITPAKKPKGSYEVFDGGRRWRALRLLVDRGIINEADYDVPVKVLTGDNAELSETSTAANFHQLKMTPAEECRAFLHFIGTNGDVDAVAKRFGVTRRFVEGRLRLATLADPIFEALNAGDITLDVAKAYASTESHEKQLLVWGSYGGHTYVNADTIRRTIANETMKANDPVAILIGEDRYVAAGGRVDRDLFSDSGDRWVDPEIAQRIAGDIMEAEAKRIGEELGLAWIRPIASNYPHSASAGLYRVTLPPVDLTEEQLARTEAIDARQTEISEAMEDETASDEVYQALDKEFEALTEEAHGLLNQPRLLPDDLKTRVGAFLKLTPKGEMVLDSDYYSEEQIRFGDPANPVLDDGDTKSIGGGSDISVPAPRPETIAPGGKPLSARLFDELAMQRRDVLAAAMLSNPALALDYALFVMIDDRNSSFGSYGTTIRARPPQDPVTGEKPVTRARDYLAEAHDGLDMSWIDNPSEVDRFEAFRVMDDDGKAAWLAYVVALSLEAKPTYTAQPCALHNRLATIMEIDVASWWRPTSNNFFDRVSKGSILSLLGEVGGAALTARHATMKKSEISGSCEKLFAGEVIIEAETREAALAWVPDAMRFLDNASSEGLELEDDDAAGETGTDDLGAEPDADGGEVGVEGTEEPVGDEATGEPASPGEDALAA